MPIIKIYNYRKPKIDNNLLLAIICDYFEVPRNKTKLVFIKSLELDPSGLFIEINAKKGYGRTPSIMQKCLKELEKLLKKSGYHEVMIRIELFPDKDLFGIN